MATIFMLLGLPGAGKTVLGKQIERERPALRLCPDEWMARIVGNGYDNERRETIDLIQMEVAVRALELGIDVVFESAGWSRADRYRQRAMVAAVPDADFKLIWLDVPHDELLRRLAARNAALPEHTFEVKPGLFAQMIDWFEPPGPDEHAERRVG